MGLGLCLSQRWEVGFRAWLESRVVVGSQGGARTGPPWEGKLLHPELGMVRHETVY